MLLLSTNFSAFIENLAWRGFLVLEVLFGIGLLIFIHEFGHFIAAKWFKVRVEIFSLGFGSPIQIGKWKLSKFYHGTEYRIAFVPFGGYVKMAGDWPGEETTGAGDEFNSKPVYQRMIIMVAGVVMNALLSIVLFMWAYYYGVQFHAPKLGSVTQGSSAWQAGLQPGDEVTELNGEPIFTFDEIIPIIAFSEKEVEIKIRREKEKDSNEFEIKTFQVSPQYDEQMGFRAIGVRQSYQRSGRVVEGLAAYEAGLRTEDELISVNGKKAKYNGDIFELTRDSFDSEPLIIRIRRPAENNAEKEIEIHPKVPSYFIGIIMTQRFLEAVRGKAAPFFQPGDEIIHVEGQKLHIFSKIQEYAVTQDPAKKPTITFEIKRKEQQIQVEVPTLLLQSPLEEKEGFYQDLAPKGNNTLLGEVVSDKPAALAGLKVGDEIIQINDTPIDSFSTMSSIIANSKGQALTVTYRRDKQEQKTTITPEKRLLFELGIEVGPELLKEPLQSKSFLDAISLGFKQTKQMAQHVFLMLISLFTREVHPSNLGGPVTIFQASYNFAQFGFGRMIHWLALISINLAVINVLPIPVLDGGHLMFLFFEKLKGSPLNPQTMLIFQYIGLVFILILMVYVTFNDISRLFDIFG